MVIAFRINDQKQFCYFKFCFCLKTINYTWGLLIQVSANTEDSSMSGYLYRSKGSKKPWKHLWFVIKNKVLYTYAASEVRSEI